MAAHDKVQWHPPLKAPAVEVIDLLSDSDSVDTSPGARERQGKHDAHNTVLSAPKADGDIQWRAPLKAPAVEFDDSLSRDLPTGMGEVLGSGEDVPAQARDASVEESDSDEDSQWSLYEDALGGDEDEIAIHASMLYQCFLHRLPWLTYALVTTPVHSRSH